MIKFQLIFFLLILKTYPDTISFINNTGIDDNSLSIIWVNDSTKSEPLSLAECSPGGSLLSIVEVPSNAKMFMINCKIGEEIYRSILTSIVKNEKYVLSIDKHHFYYKIKVTRNKRVSSKESLEFMAHKHNFEKYEKKNEQSEVNEMGTSEDYRKEDLF